jgi:hypothetical protein
MPSKWTLECDLKTEVDFVSRGADFEMPCRADFRCNLKTEVDFVPHGVDLRCKKLKALSGKPK